MPRQYPMPFGLCVLSASTVSRHRVYRLQSFGLYSIGQALPDSDVLYSIRFTLFCQAFVWLFLTMCLIQSRGRHCMGFNVFILDCSMLAFKACVHSIKSFSVCQYFFSYWCLSRLDECIESHCTATCILDIGRVYGYTVLACMYIVWCQVS